MRFVVLLLGIVAVILTGSMGVLFITNNVREIVAQVPDGLRDLVRELTSSPLDTPHVDTGVFLLLSAGYGLLGVLLAFARCGRQGGLMLLVPVLTTALMNPFSFIFTGLQAFVGVLAFFVFPLPLAPPKSSEEDEDE
jgi:hypothetical protein